MGGRPRYLAPSIEPFGCHHTKMMLLFYGDGLRVVIGTANMKQRHWTAKTNGVWVSPLFPRADPGVAQVASFELDDHQPGFARDLLEYLAHYVDSGGGAGPGRQHRDRARFIGLVRKVAAHDMSGAGSVRLAGSVPGSHTGRYATRWGHLRVRELLAPLAGGWAADDLIVMQASSIGSMAKKGSKAKTRAPGDWLEPNLLRSLCGGAASLQPAAFVWPTIAEVRGSYEGYAGGFAIPYQARNAKQQVFLRDQLAHRWRAGWCGRDRAAPHIKTYCRLNPRTNALRWALLTSSNLSTAAWGTWKTGPISARNDPVVDKLSAVKNYELGVLFTAPEGSNGLVPASQSEQHRNGPRVPLPYDLPLTRYGPTDRMWVVDAVHAEPDPFGKTCAGWKLIDG